MGSQRAGRNLATEQPQQARCCNDNFLSTPICSHNRYHSRPHCTDKSHKVSNFQQVTQKEMRQKNNTRPGSQSKECHRIYNTLHNKRYDSSAVKESTCDAGDPGLIPGSGRSPGERTGYPLQYSWASLVAQLGKNPPAMQETWV